MSEKTKNAFSWGNLFLGFLLLNFLFGSEKKARSGTEQPADDTFQQDDLSFQVIFFILTAVITPVMLFMGHGLLESLLLGMLYSLVAAIGLMLIVLALYAIALVLLLACYAVIIGIPLYILYSIAAWGYRLFTEITAVEIG